jgi:DHA2 family multidrug resistance protein
MVILQNYHITHDVVAGLENMFGNAGIEVFRMLEEFMSANYGFKYVWLDAGFWGFVGSIFVFMLFVPGLKTVYVKMIKYVKDKK